jgi:uncharacterized protein YdeI (YjbR/CyaY-like superfamily)
MADDLPRMLFATREEFEAWMHEHHRTAPGVWLLVAKKGAPYPTISRDDLVEVGLMYGWIDGLVNSVDEHSYAQRFTPRRPRSVWSLRNVGIVERLTAEGRMQPAGQAHVDAAKADGRWERAYAGHAQPQDDLMAALAAHGATEAYEALPKSMKNAMYFRIQSAVRPETRARRIAEFVRRIAAGEPPIT